MMAMMMMMMMMLIMMMVMLSLRRPQDTRDAQGARSGPADSYRGGLQEGMEWMWPLTAGPAPSADPGAVGVGGGEG